MTDCLGKLSRSVLVLKRRANKVNRLYMINSPAITHK